MVRTRALSLLAIGLIAGGNAVLRDSRIIGATDNQTGPPKPDDPAFPIRGFEFYDGQAGVERTAFANFVSDARRHASALSALRFSPFFTDPTNFARNLTFENAQPVFFEPAAAKRDRAGADGYRGSVFRDLDGSVTGRAGASVVIDTPLLAARDCRPERAWNAPVCAAGFGSRRDAGPRGHDRRARRRRHRSLYRRQLHLTYSRRPQRSASRCTMNFSRRTSLRISNADGRRT